MAFVLPLLPALGAAVGATGATAAGLSVASTAVSALGVGAQALAAKNSADFQAKLANVQAKQAQAQASVKASEVARETRQTTAAMRAGALQNGFDLSGSMADILDQSERQGQLDYLTAVYDGSVQATGLRATAKNFKRQGKNAIIGGVLGMGAQALGGVADIYKMRGNSISVTGT